MGYIFAIADPVYILVFLIEYKGNLYFEQLDPAHLEKWLK